ncbi:MAG: relaxase/mobilization nuclease domain-containing protein [Legionella sp.]|uniref:TraI/MobA(P) family conjugative relaxase n=1 Tax=Legionella sp. TaxID=459 RepID=UPI0039E4118C
MNTVKKSNFLKLAQYITNTQGKQERVGLIRVSNCLNTEPAWASHEIMATQAKNQRAKGDKTYHLLISFAPGENPSPNVLKTIEDRVVNSIGFTNHQRISAIHYDTDNVHIHVAINKIHPHQLTMVEPYRAYKTLGKIAEILETEFGLQKTNHKAQKVRSENLAEDMEHHAHMESLLGWIKRTCKDKLENSSDWMTFHQILTEHGLQVQECANGLIILDSKGLAVKASSISRNLSKSKLESRLGSFKPFNSKDQNRTSKQSSYELQPLKRTIQSSLLYSKYKAEQSYNKQTLTQTLLAARERKERLIEQAKRHGRFKRATVKLSKSSRLNKKILYSLISSSLKKELHNIRKEYLQERTRLFETYRCYAWADWLLKQSLQGNKDALTAMRDKKEHPNSYYSFKSPKESNSSLIQHQLDGITKEGTAIYRIDNCTIRDNGKEIGIYRGASIQSLKTALHMAKERFGSLVSVTGTPQFKESLIRIAVHYQIPIQFEDPKMEQLRNHLIKIKGEIHEQSCQRRRSYRKATGSSNETIRTRRSDGDRTQPRIGIHNTTSTKSNIERIGREPPPENKNSLRNMSSLNMVQLSRRSKMLLSNNVYPQLECQRTQSDHSVRRTIFGLKRKEGKKRIK